jgi:accessory gene regulator protein AgrB
VKQICVILMSKSVNNCQYDYTPTRIFVNNWIWLLHFIENLLSILQVHWVHLQSFFFFKEETVNLLKRKNCTCSLMISQVKVAIFLDYCYLFYFVLIFFLEDVQYALCYPHIL